MARKVLSARAMSLPSLFASATPFADTLLRVGFGLTLFTHGLPKLLGTAHGSMADPMVGSIRLIELRLGLPFAPQLAVAVALLEAGGGTLITLGLATRPLALAFLLQMVGICFALGPTYPWIDRGIEYPIILGLIAMLFVARGGGALSLDRVAHRS